eukprot:943505-Alexandrium_andersonii.AAC.1
MRSAPDLPCWSNCASEASRSFLLSTPTEAFRPLLRVRFPFDRSETSEVSERPLDSTRELKAALPS